MKNQTDSETTSSSTEPAQASTTFNTWGRVAEDHMNRMGDLMAQGTKMQAAAFNQSRELLAHNMKLAGEFQSWVSEAGRSLASNLFSSK